MGNKTVFYNSNSHGKLSFRLTSYQNNNRPAIVCEQFDEEMGCYVPYATATTNLSDWELEPGHVAVGFHNFDKSFINTLFESKVLNGDIKNPIAILPQGFVDFFVYELNESAFQ